MPYPFVRWPTFGELRQKLIDDFQCRYTEVSGSVNGRVYGTLERTVDGKTMRYAVPYSDGQRLAPSVVRSICAHLRVDGSAFGLTLG